MDEASPAPDPDGDRAPLEGACPAWPPVVSDGGVGQRWGAGSPACPGGTPDPSGTADPGAPDEDGWPAGEDCCPPDEAGLPDVEGVPPEGDCWPPDEDELPDELAGEVLPPLGDDGGIVGVGTETLGVAQPAAPSETTATKQVNPKFCRQFKDFSAQHGTRSLARHRAAHILRSTRPGRGSTGAGPRGCSGRCAAAGKILADQE